MAYQISYTKTVEHNVTEAEYYLIKDLSEGKQVPAIKFIRKQYNTSLREAKDICDSIWADRATYVPD